MFCTVEGIPSSTVRGTLEYFGGKPSVLWRYPVLWKETTRTVEVIANVLLVSLRSTYPTKLSLPTTVLNQGKAAFGESRSHNSIDKQRNNRKWFYFLL